MPGDVTTRSELLALFDVIGSPSWADAELVQVSHAQALLLIRGSERDKNLQIP